MNIEQYLFKVGTHFFKHTCSTAQQQLDRKNNLLTPSDTSVLIS